MLGEQGIQQYRVAVGDNLTTLAVGIFSKRGKSVAQAIVKSGNLVYFPFSYNAFWVLEFFGGIAYERGPEFTYLYRLLVVIVNDELVGLAAMRDKKIPFVMCRVLKDSLRNIRYLPIEKDRECFCVLCLFLISTAFV